MHVRSRSFLHVTLAAGLVLGAAARPASAQQAQQAQHVPQAQQSLAPRAPTTDVAASAPKAAGPTMDAASVAVRAAGHDRGSRNRTPRRAAAGWAGRSR